MLLHYREGGVESPTLDPLLSNGIELTEAEMEDLTLFLETLTDWAFLQDERF